MKKKLLYALAVLFGLLVFGIVLIWVWPSGPPASKVFSTPQSNAYPSLVRLGGEFGERVKAEDMPKKDLADFVTRHSNLLERARRKLDQECAVPVELSQSYTDRHGHDLVRLKTLAAGLEAQARLAQVMGNCQKASELYLDLLKFGHQITRNGLAIDWFQGAGAMGRGYSGLQGLADELSLDQCLDLIDKIEDLEQQRERLPEIIDRERAWSDDPFKSTMIVLIGKKILQPKYNDSRKPVGQTLKKLGSRAYQLDHGKAPPSPRALVPKYLSKIPGSSGNRPGAAEAAP